MQPEHVQPDTAPLPDPTSPAFPTLHRHHQPAHTADPYPENQASSSGSGSGLRRRHTGSTEGETILVKVRTPFDDASSQVRRKEGTAILRSKRIADFKDEIAEGLHAGDGETWVREGLRLVWQGRIVRDEELLGEIVSAARDPHQVHTFHLVARRTGRPRTPLISRANSRSAVPTTGTINPPLQHNHHVAPATPPPSQAVDGANTPSAELQALTDCIHYLLFAARHHLFSLLGRKPLQWNEMVPPPVVDQDTARQAIISLLQVIIPVLGGNDASQWQQWELAFDGMNKLSLTGIWDGLGSRENVEGTVRGIWRERLGRDWSENGEIVPVETDGITRDLHLPPLRLMSPTQLTHLLQYLRIISLLPRFYPLLSRLYLRESTPAPTHYMPQSVSMPTRTQPPPPPVITTLASLISRSIPRIPLPVLSHMFFSAVKLVAMLWMLTQGMPWSDTRLWIIAGAATGWWIGDSWNQYLRDRRERNAANAVNVAATPLDPANDAARPAAEGPTQPQPGSAAPPANANANANANPDPADPVAARAAALAAEVDRVATARRQMMSHPLWIPPTVHLSTDARQLRLPVDWINPHNPNNRSTDGRPVQRPPWIVTQVLLPICLWFITLVPEFERLRTRIIRQRESTIRVMVGELNSPPPDSDADPAGTAAELQEEDGSLPPREPILPAGLNLEARKYYLRVVQRGEGIDWEEEREAQRAMGVGQEEEGGGFVGIF